MMRGIDNLFLKEKKITIKINIIAKPSVIVVSFLICRALYTATIGPPIQSIATESISAALSASSNPETNLSLFPVSPIPLLGWINISIVERSLVNNLPLYISYCRLGLNCSNFFSKWVPMFNGSRITTSPMTMPEGDVKTL